MASKGLPPASGDINISWKLEVGTTVTFLAATIVVALCCFTRWKYSRRGWDDYLIIFALESLRIFWEGLPLCHRSLFFNKLWPL